MTPLLVRSMWLMAAAILALTAMDMVAKILVESEVHPITILAIRSVIITCLLLGSLAYRNKLSTLRTKKLPAHILRGMIGLTAVGSFFTALKYLPLADAQVVFFTGTLFIAIASVLVLKERFGAHRWLAIGAGYFGVSIAMNPSLDGMSVGYLFALVGALSYAGLFISGKILSKTESTTCLVFYFNTGMGIAACAALPFFWKPLTADLWLMIIAVALLALAGHLAITQAFSSCEASVLAPIEYTGLLWAVILDYLVWSHTPDNHTLLGGSIVVLSGLYFLHRERKHKQPEAATLLDH